MNDVFKAFPRSHRGLRTDGMTRHVLTLLLATSILGAWSIWFTCAKVSVYAVSQTARFETAATTQSVESDVEGRVTAVSMRVGQRMKAGDVLVRLDAHAQSLERNALLARLESLQAQRQAIAAEVDAAEKGLGPQAETVAHAYQARIAELTEARLAAQLASEEAERGELLRQRDAVSQAETRRLDTTRRRRAAQVASIERDLKRLTSLQELTTIDRAAEVQHRRRELAMVEGDIAAAHAGIERLAFDIEQRVIRALVDGRVGACAELVPGQVVRPGQRLGVLIPDGHVTIVAQFPPAQALGHIKRDQRAFLRLAGFPWTQYGMVASRVLRVATEVRDGLVRVELTLDDETHARVPLSHGLPGTVEVEIERMSPAHLVWRAAGERFDGIATPSEPDAVGS